MQETHFEKIEQYLNGEMSNEDQRHFESALATDEELALAFRMYKAIEKDMRSNYNYEKQDAALKSTLQRFNKSYFEQSGVGDDEKPLDGPEASRKNFNREPNVAIKQRPARSKLISLVAKLAAASVILVLGW